MAVCGLFDGCGRRAEAGAGAEEGGRVVEMVAGPESEPRRMDLGNRARARG